jgi:DNA polymerase lambda
MKVFGSLVRDDGNIKSDKHIKEKTNPKKKRTEGKKYVKRSKLKNKEDKKSLKSEEKRKQSISSNSELEESEEEVKVSNSKPKKTGKKSDVEISQIQHLLESGGQKNVNEHITSELEKVLKIHKTNNDKFRILAYQKAIRLIKAMKEKITSIDQIKDSNFIGKSIREKIGEILSQGEINLNRKTLKSDKKTESLNELMQVYGIGEVFAKKLYEKGITSLKELRKHQNLLNSKQVIGLKYCEELNQKIPRKESLEISNIIKDTLAKTIPKKSLEVQICGSYRREKAETGDIDLLITRKDEGDIEGIGEKLIKELIDNGLIKETLGQSHAGEPRFHFMGICQIKSSVHRRIDIKIYKKENYPFALLYFTGSANFNRLMREYAKKKGYLLNDYCLEIVGKGKNDKNNKTIKCSNEEDIFKALGMEKYVEPKDRDI